MKQRLDQLRTLMRDQELDAFLVTDGMNRRYLSGFTGSAGVLLVTNEKAYIVTDFRYFEQTGREAVDWLLWKVTNKLSEAVGGLLEEVQPRRLGFEADGLTVAEWRHYRSAGPETIEWVSTEGLVRRMRAVKSQEEIERIRRAQAITDAAAEQLPALIQPGKSEKEVQWELEVLMRALGADKPAFEIIVASGPNSALPHYHPGERLIEADEIVLVDFGARVAGYNSDMTRTYFTGEPTEEYARVYNIVLDALSRAEAQLRAGMGAKEADSVVRDFIGEHGHREDFGHGLGHGVGLDIHELPGLSYRTKEEEQVQVGHVVTIEPGIYLPGWGGVRIEDLALVTEDGLDIFTTASKNIDAWRQGQP